MPAGLAQLLHLLWGWAVELSGGLSFKRAGSAGKTFVELHSVLVTNRFSVWSMRQHRLLVIVISLSNGSCF